VLGRRLRQMSPGRRGLAAIIGGTAAGQMIALASSPLLTRLYSPGSFGTFSVVTAMALVLSSAAAFRYELAIPLPKDDRDGYALVTLGLTSAAVTAAVGALVLGLLREPLAGVLGVDELTRWSWVVAPLASVMACFQVLNQLAIRQQRYASIARRNLVQSSSTVVIQLLGGLVGARAGGLILGIGLGQATGVVSLTAGAGLATPAAREGRRRPVLRAVAHRYRRFPQLLAPAGMLNALGISAPTLLIAAFYGGAAAGWFGLTQRVLALPVTLVGQAVAQVYLSELARSRRDLHGNARALFRSTSLHLAYAGAAGATVLVLAGPLLFSAVFGSSWTTSGEMARAMAAALAAQIVASPVSQTLIVLERNRTQLAWDAGRLLVVSGTIAICGWAGLAVVDAVRVYAAASTLTYLVSWWLSRQALTKDSPFAGPGT
jgi:O-antigen/teichoic acid export membrane protein